jgi:predicted dienelactone hydrolase
VAFGPAADTAIEAQDDEELMRFLWQVAMALAATFASASAQQIGRPADPPFTLPDDVDVRKVAIWSGGTRLAGDLYVRKGAAGKLPTIVMAYGWGGTKANFRAEAASFAQAGFLAVLFDYRGWGESDGRLVAAEPLPAERFAGTPSAPTFTRQGA